jgi:hypothetical protein
MPGFPGYAAPSMDQMYSYQMSAPGRQNQPQNAPALLLPHHQMALPSMPASYPGPGGSYHLPNSMSSASTDLDSITSTERLSFGSGSQHRQQQSGSQFISASSSTSDSPEKVSPTHGYSSHSGDAYHHNHHHHHHQYPQHQVKENNFTRQQQNGYPPNKQHYSNNSANYLAANNNVPVALNVSADAKNYNYF